MQNESNVLENIIDVSRYGFELYKQNNDFFHYRKIVHDYYIELDELCGSYTITICRNDSRIIVANRYEITEQSQLDFLLKKGRCSSAFSDV